MINFLYKYLGEHMRQILRYTLIIFIFLGIAACGGSNTPEKVAENFYSNLASGKVDKAIELIDMNDLEDSEMTQAKAKLTALLTMAVEESKKKGVDMGKVTVKNVEYTDNDTKATVTISMSDKNGESTETMSMIKRDGNWKIQFK